MDVVLLVKYLEELSAVKEVVGGGRERQREVLNVLKRLLKSDVQ